MSRLKSFLYTFKGFLKNFCFSIGVLIFVCFVGGCFFVFMLFPDSSSLTSIRSNPLKEGSILTLNLEGAIMDSDDFIEDLNKYVKNDKVKGVLIRINSPGGGVTPSEEIYKEILRIKKVYKKPVVISIGSFGASGAFYVAMAGDKIVANESSLLGSIGVIMYLSNFEELYEWAKMEYYVIKTGEFKDAGSNFRALTPRERDVFQDLIDQLLAQFKKAIVTSRSLATDLVDEFSDGRVFLGEDAVVQGFIDQIGTYQEAVTLVGTMSGLGEDPHLFEPPEEIESLWKDIILSTLARLVPFKFNRRAEFNGRPLYIMPEHIGF